MGISKMASLSLVATACTIGTAPLAAAAPHTASAPAAHSVTPTPSATLTPNPNLTPSAVKNSPNIIGGEAINDPSVVQLIFQQNGGTYGCTGEIIGSQWVLTAQHCTKGDTAMNVYTSNDTQNRGTAIAADRLYNSAYGDVALVHLSRATSAPRVQMANSYTPNTRDNGYIEGYGARAYGQSAEWLYGASVSITGRSTDAFGGAAIHVQGIDGAANHGDSGGPLFVNGQVVGVCSTGDSVDPGANTNATSNYANLTASRSWIRSIAGV